MSWGSINAEIRKCRSKYDQKEKVVCLKNLLEKTNNDGMVALAMGEELETLGNRHSAISYYKMAENRFPLKFWKEVARKKIRNIGGIETDQDEMTKTSIKPRKDIPSAEIRARYISCFFECDQQEAEWYFEDLRSLIRRFVAEVPLEDKPLIRKIESYSKFKETYKRSDTNLIVYLEVTYKKGVTIAKITFDGGSIIDSDNILLVFESIYEEATLLNNAQVEVLRCLACGAPLKGSTDEFEFITCIHCDTRQRFLKKKYPPKERNVQ